MIGVICEDRQKPSVCEFFELFKVPWEFYVSERAYDVVIVTGHTDSIPIAKLLIAFGSNRKPSDVGEVTQIHPGTDGVLLELHSYQFPVYLMTAIFDSSSKPLMKVSGGTAVVGVEYATQEQRVLRIGYDLFDEVGFLLLRGQPVERADIPTLDIHIAVLRDWILDAGILLVEIPSRPEGYNFTVCLTHDVDFINIRDHRIDRSVLGFIGRVLFPSYVRDMRSKVAWCRIFRNLKALLSLPGVYIGLCRDVWFDIDRYVELEKDMGSTFYFIPLKDHPGDSAKNKEPDLRAARYDVREHKALIDNLRREGFEIGLHGIDAWQDLQKGSKERNIISEISGEDCMGLRMHWLYFSEDSPALIEQAGFLYDSTLGYNERIGYRSGTTQVFCLPGTSQVFELPLNVMDTALFYPKRMSLSEAEALSLCRRVIDDLRAYGGVLTTNWHTRSLSPERNWDAFYIELLKILKKENVWFATAKQAVKWFEKRRSIHFNGIELSRNKIRLKLISDNDNNLPNVLLRIHNPQIKSINTKERTEDSSRCNRSFIDIPWSGEPEIELDLLKHFDEAYQKNVVI
jgi:hypothetical protein